MTDFGPGSPTGGLCYLSDGLPEQYRGRLIFCEWGKGNIAAIEVAREGATFRFVTNTPQSAPGADFRPMQVGVAADGSLLIADWGWGGWKAPKQLGTIWRLSWPEARPAPRLPDESKASVEELIAALGHPDRDQRLRAQTELVKKGTAELNAIRSWEEAKTPTKTRVLAALSDLARDEGAATIARCHALWALENVGGRGADEWIDNYRLHPGHPANLAGLDFAYHGIYRLLPVTWYKSETKTGSSNPVVRAQAMRALGVSRWKYDCEVIGEAAGNLIKSADPGERRETAHTIGKTSASNAPHQLLALLTDPDRAVRFTARRGLQNMIERMGLGSWDLDTVAFAKPELSDEEWQTFDGLRLADPHTPELRKNTELWGNQQDVLDYIKGRLTGEHKATPADRARAALLLGRWAYQPKPYDGKWWGTQPVKNPPPPASVAWAGTPPALAALTAALADADPGVRLAVAQAFTGFTLDAAGKPAGAALRARLSTETEATVRRQLIEALGVQRDPEARGVFTAIALDEKAAAEFRDTAISAVVRIGGDAAKQTIAQLAGARVSPAATRKIIEATGELRVLEAAPALIAHFADENAGNRQAAVKALAQLGPKANATPPLIAALADPDKVKQAALEALGALRDKAALPALLEFAKTKKNSRELIAALAAMPDPQSIPVLVNALRDNNSGLRRNALKALKTMRAAALPPIDEMLASGKIPKEYEPEIRAAFDSGAIAKWKMIGPFENVWGAVHDPERDALRSRSTGLQPVRPTGFQPVEPPPQPVENPLAGQVANLSAGTPDLGKKYVNAEGKEAGWRDVTADNDAGHVNLEKVFATNGMVCAYAFAEIEAPAEAEARLLCGSDDQIAIWLNGAKLHDSGPGSRGYEEHKDDVPLHFAAGKNALLVKIGNSGGGWEFNARIPGLDGSKFAKPPDAAPEAKQRAFALAQNTDGTWTNRGDAKKGKKIFHDTTGPLGGICAQCHKVRGLGADVGPDLSLVGSVYKRGDLLISIMEPGKTIALGYEQIMVETKGGDTFAGAIRKDIDDTLTLLGADQQPHVVKKADIKAQTPVPASIMPPALTLGLKPEDLANLLAYLESLRGN